MLLNPMVNLLFEIYEWNKYRLIQLKGNFGNLSIIWNFMKSKMYIELIFNKLTLKIVKSI